VLHTKNEDEQMIQVKDFLLHQEGDDFSLSYTIFIVVLKDKNAER
jgi:hypothetical protein